MARKYEAIWTAIKAAKVQAPVFIRVHENYVPTLVQAVKKEKSLEVATKKKLGMPFAGNLLIKKTKDKKDKEFVIVEFALEWDGAKL